MKIVFKFKDGVTVTQDFPDDNIKISGDSNFLDLLLKGKRDNEIIAVEGTNGNVLERRYSELYSVEIVLPN